MTMSREVCRLCLEGTLVNVLRLKGVPRNIQRLLNDAEIAKDSPIDLDVMRCEQCGFVQIPPRLDDSYYDDYVMAATHSSQMQEYQARQADSLVSKYGLVGKKVLEAGCGDGSFLSHLILAGADAYGIEPSAPFRASAVARGHRVEGGYLGRGRVLNEGPFDGFVTRQVLEHVPDIHDFLSGIRENLRPGAVGLIEVPSLEKAIQDDRFYDFFTDHVNYFSLRTLKLAAEMNGFEIISVGQDMYDEYNVAIVRCAERPLLESIQASIHLLTDDLRRLLAAANADGRKVLIWGAGGKGLTVLAATGLRNVAALVDSDLNKQGRRTPVSHLLVEEPSRERVATADIVVITAMAYHHEIVRTLRRDLGFCGRVFLLGPRLVLVE